MNSTTGTSSTAAKFASAFALAHHFRNDSNSKASRMNAIIIKPWTALILRIKNMVYTQTASVRSPYIYAEDNWADDMEFAFASIHTILSDQ